MRILLLVAAVCCAISVGLTCSRADVVNQYITVYKNFPEKFSAVQKDGTPEEIDSDTSMEDETDSSDDAAERRELERLAESVRLRMGMGSLNTPGPSTIQTKLNSKEEGTTWGSSIVLKKSPAGNVH